MGLFDFLVEWISPKQEKRKRVFISFSMQDARYRDYLVKQAKDSRSPFDFVDMSVKERWDENEWKRKCRTKIKGCDCVIVLLSKNTIRSKGARWEMRCAKEESVRLVGMHIKGNDQAAILPELKGCKVIKWSWNNLKHILK